MANRTVFSLAAAMGALSFLMSHYDRFFFTLHFLESLIYLVILLLMFFRLEEWAYVIGMAAPVFWLLLASAAGVLSGGNIAEFGKALIGAGIDSPVRFVGALMIFVAVGLMISSVRAFKKAIWGTPEAIRILSIGTGIVVAFYASIAYAVWQMATA